MSLRAPKGYCKEIIIHQLYSMSTLTSLLRELKNCEAGVAVDESAKISFLAYADDIVLLLETESGLQKLIDIVNDWSLRWRMKVNVNNGE